MPSISSPGVGSGLDIAGLVQQLVAAEGTPVKARIDRDEARTRAELSAYGSLKSALSELADALEGMQDPAAFLARKARSGDDTVFTASVSSSAVPARYSVEVLELAQAHKLTSGAFAGADALVGTGTLTITVGAASFSVEIGDGAGTLDGIRDAINAAADNTGVLATIVNAADGSHLVLAAEDTGSEHAVTVTQSGGDGGLAAIEYDPANGLAGLTESAAASDARVLIDGFEVVSAGNTVSGAIDGVTIDLQGAAPGEPTELVIENDTAAVSKTLHEFADAWNRLVAKFDELTAFNPETGIAAPLQGDASVRAMRVQLRRELGTPFESATLPFRMLSEIGIETGVDGKLTVDDARLSEVLASDFQRVGRLFTAADGGFARRLHERVDGMLAADGMLEIRRDGLNDRMDDIADRRTALDDRLAALEARLFKQFNALDSLLGQLSATSNYLTQQLANLPTYRAGRRD